MRGRRPHWYSLCGLCTSGTHHRPCARRLPRMQSRRSAALHVRYVLPPSLSRPHARLVCVSASAPVMLSTSTSAPLILCASRALVVRSCSCRPLPSPPILVRPYAFSTSCPFWRDNGLCSASMPVLIPATLSLSPRAASTLCADRLRADLPNSIHRSS